MTRFIPTKEQLVQWDKEGKSYSDIKKICGYSKGYISGLYKKHNIPKKMGRKKDFKATEETRRRMSEAIKKIHDEGY
jgi:hypothetical protein